MTKKLAYLPKNVDFFLFIWYKLAGGESYDT